MSSVAGMRSTCSPGGRWGYWRKGYLSCPVLEVRKLRLSRESVASHRLQCRQGKSFASTSVDCGVKRGLASPTVRAWVLSEWTWANAAHKSEENFWKQEEDPQEVAGRNWCDPLGVHTMRKDFGVLAKSLGWGVGQQWGRKVEKNY